MTKSKKLRSLTVAALAATALFAAQPAAATTEITLNGMWAGGNNDIISFTGNDWHTGAAAADITNKWAFAGGFSTTNKATGATFQSFCVDIFHFFNGFPITSNDSLSPATIISGKAATDLGRLFTAHGDAVNVKQGIDNAHNEAAFQLAVWEIVNEQKEGVYNVSSGNFQASGADAGLAQQWLNSLAAVSQFTASVWKVESTVTKGNGAAQDVVVFNPVPEPQTYAMMLVGLGLLGFSARRKNQNLG